MDMKCEECGAIIPNGAKVCPNCGCPVDAYSKNNKINKQKFIKSPKIVVVFILLITIIGFSYLYHINNNQNRTSVTNVASEDNKVGDAAYEIGYKLGLGGHINYPLQSTIANRVFYILLPKNAYVPTAVRNMVLYIQKRIV